MKKNIFFIFYSYLCIINAFDVQYAELHNRFGNSECMTISSFSLKEDTNKREANCNRTLKIFFYAPFKQENHSIKMEKTYSYLQENGFLTTKVSHVDDCRRTKT
jgi:hypothetical protein